MRALAPPKMGDLAAIFFWWGMYAAMLRNEAEGNVYITEPYRYRRKRRKGYLKMMARAVRKAGFRN